jgi:hypothetical protein
MRDVLRPLRHVDVVRLVGQVALDVVDDLLALLGIHLAPLRHQHLRQLGVGDVAQVGGQLGPEAPEEEIVDLGEGRGGPHGHLFVLADHRGGAVLAVLLGFQLDRDAHLAQVVGGQLVVRAPRHDVPGPMEHRHREAVAVARLREQLPGLGRIVADEGLGLGGVHLGGVELPLRHGARHRPRVDAALAEEQRVVPRLAVDRQRHRSPHPHVVEGRLVGPEADVALPDDPIRRDAQLGVRLLERLGLLRADPAPDVRQLGLAGAQHGDAGGGVGRDLDGDAVEVGQALHEVARVALEDDAHALVVRLQDERAGPDDGIGVIEVLELVLGLARQDGAEGRAREVIQERRVRLLQRDAHRVAVDDVDAGHRLEARAERRPGHEAVERVLHVLRGDLAPVHGRLVVEAHALAQVEGVDLAVLRDRPLLGEVGDDREIGRRLLLGPVREPHELAVAQADVGVRQEADRQVWIEVRSLALGDAQHAAALGGLGVGDGRRQQGGQQGHGDQGSHSWAHHASSSRVERSEKSAPIMLGGPSLSTRPGCQARAVRGRPR